MRPFVCGINASVAPSKCFLDATDECDPQLGRFALSPVEASQRDGQGGEALLLGATLLLTSRRRGGCRDWDVDVGSQLVGGEALVGAPKALRQGLGNLFAVLEICADHKLHK